MASNQDVQINLDRPDVTNHHVEPEPMRVRALLKETIPFSLKLIILYLFLILVIMPSAFAPPQAPNTAVTGLPLSQESGGLLERFHRVPLVIGLAMVISAFLTRRHLKGMALPITLFLIFCCAYLINGLFGPAGPIESFRLLFAQVGMGLSLVLTIRKPSHLQYFLKAFMVVALINAIYGLLFTIPFIAHLGEVLASSGLPFGRDHSGWRLIGLLSDPTNCGLLLTAGFLIILDRVFEKIQFGDTTLALVFFTAIFLTFSRTAWAGTLAGLLFLMGLKKIAPMKLALVSIIGGAFVAIAYQIFAFSIHENLFRWDIAHSDTRSGVWLFWSYKVLRRPFGYGIGYVREICDAQLGPAPHNTFLSIWTDGGIQSLIPLLFLLWVCFLRQWRIRKYIDPETGKNYSPLLLALLVGTSVSLFGLSFMTQLLFIFMGLCLSCSQLANDGTLVHRDELSA